MAQIPLSLDDAGRDAGYWPELSMPPVETSRTLVSGDDVHAPAFSGAPIVPEHGPGSAGERRAVVPPRPPSGRDSHPPPGGTFKAKIGQYCDLVTLNVFCKSSRLKQYLNLKDGIALRIETVINSPVDLRCNRRLANLPELQAKARTINDRLLHT